MHLTKAKQFLTDAEYLQADKRYDSAVSRCYYALYRYCIVYLEKQGNIRPAWNHGTLRKVIQEKNTEVNGISLYNALFDAYGLRTAADYEKMPVSVEKCRTLIARIKPIFKEDSL